MDGFLKLETSLGVATERVIPLSEVARIETPPPGNPHAVGGCTISLKNGTTIDCTDSGAYAAVLGKVGSLGYTVA